MSDRSVTLSRLIEGARAGQEAARTRLLESFRPYLELLARTGIGAALRSKADAADLVQDTLLRAHQHFAQFRGAGEKQLAAWLRRILARCLADLGRRYREADARQVDRERSLQDALDASSASLGAMIAVRGNSPSQSAMRREMTVVLAEALAALPDDQREVLMMRSIQERDWPDVAGALQRSEGAARMLWARALKQLRPLIEERL